MKKKIIGLSNALRSRTVIINISTLEVYEKKGLPDWVALKKLKLKCKNLESVS